jgi:hypothetical protein
MKKINTVLFLLITSFTFSQTITFNGVIKDITTQLPIEAVTISVENSSLGTISNEEGKFRLSFPEKLNELKFNHLNYNVFKYIVKKTDNEIEIYLEPKSYTLNEVVIRNKPIQDILKDVVQNSKKQFEKSILLNTYYREFVRVNDKYTNFSDGLLDYNVKRKNGSSDLYLKQSRAYKLLDENTKERESKIEAIYFYDVRDAISDAYNFKKLSHFLDSKNYDYEIETKTDSNENSIEVVTIIPKKEVELGLYTGTVTYDVKTKLILEMDIKKAPEHKQYISEINAIFFRFKVNEESRKAKFKIDGDKYILVYNQNKINIHIKMKNRYDDTFELMSDLVTTDYKEGEFDFDRSKRYKERSLFAAGNNFTEKYWLTNNIYLLSDTEEKVLKELK